ncbi:MAG: diacylglycerol kinase family lipid kinase [Gammaproteobacteria bacterium]|nr:diacylglycerol kinase family lipid kinase [Gammaproteobacteria bacterium]MBQ0775322.1 diacylglycerol kinase family lipid kinase [Gammaproteobacteria bacterium]
MKKVRKVLVVYNPTAGGGREKVLQRLVDALVEKSASVEVYRTKAAGDATQYLRARSDQGDVVVAVGGDGTTNEVINGLVGGVPLAIMATGTANVLARELSLPNKPEQVAELVMSGQLLEIWPGKLNGRRFLMWVGVGYDSWVVNTTDLALKRKIGKGAYMVSMLTQIARYGSKRYLITVDGKSYDCYSAIIANARYYGGSFVLSRYANIARPSLQALLFMKPGRWTLIKYMLALVLGRMESMDGVVSVAAQHIEVPDVEGELLQTDGDAAGALPAVICVDDTPLPILVPEPTGLAFSKV